MLWLYIHFPQLQLDSFLHQDETIPLAIVDERTNQLMQLNDAALEAGLTHEMGLASAAAFCRELQLYPYHRDKERLRLEQIAMSLYQYTADIALDETNGLFLRAGNMLTLYQGLEPYWQAISEQLQQEKVNFHFALAYTPTAAKLLSVTGKDLLTQDKAQIDKHLLQLSIKQLPVSNKSQQALIRVGIKHLSQLLKLPLKEVAKRFDIELVNYLGWISGQLKFQLNFYRQPARFYRHYDLSYEISNIPTLSFPLEQLYSQLESYLYHRNLVTSELLISLYQRNEQVIEVKVASAIGEYKAEQWLKLTSLRLESVKLTAPVISIALTVSELNLNNPISQPLFGRKAASMTVEELTTLLSAKLGEEKVSCIQLEDEHRPELSSRYVAPLTAVAQQSNADLRPGYLLSKPSQLQQKMTVISGPERIQSGWWDNQPICRDYFIARNELGQWCWIYRQPNNQWFIHGYFA